MRSSGTPKARSQNICPLHLIRAAACADSVKKLLREKEEWEPWTVWLKPDKSASQQMEETCYAVDSKWNVSGGLFGERTRLACGHGRLARANFSVCSGRKRRRAGCVETPERARESHGLPGSFGAVAETRDRDLVSRSIRLPRTGGAAAASCARGSGRGGRRQ